MNIQKILKQIDWLQKEIQNHRPFDENLNTVIQDRIRIEWTYNSNALEGNTLTLGETLFFLQEGLTSEGKPLKDYLEAKNHAEAIKVLNDVIQDEHGITEHFIKSLHQVLLNGIDFTYAKGSNNKLIKKPLNIGRYKTRPNHVLTLSGDIHHYAEPEQVQIEMEKLIEWGYSKEAQAISAVEKASIFHYRFVCIHPFDDGNGRLARLLMNLLLMQAGLPPCVIKSKNRHQYLSELERIDKTGQYEAFIFFIAQELFETMTLILNLLKGKSEQKPFTLTRLSRGDREFLILETLSNQSLSIGEIHIKLPQLKRPTLKKDLQNLVKEGLIIKKGIGKGVTYTVQRLES